MSVDLRDFVPCSSSVPSLEAPGPSSPQTTDTRSSSRSTVIEPHISRSPSLDFAAFARLDSSSSSPSRSDTAASSIPRVARIGRTRRPSRRSARLSAQSVDNLRSVNLGHRASELGDRSSSSTIEMQRSPGPGRTASGGSYERLRRRHISSVEHRQVRRRAYRVRASLEERAGLAESRYLPIVSGPNWIPYPFRAVASFFSRTSLPSIGRVLHQARAYMNCWRQPLSMAEQPDFRGGSRWFGSPAGRRLVRYIDMQPPNAIHFTYSELAWRCDLQPISDSTVRRLLSQQGYRRTQRPSSVHFSPEQQALRFAFAQRYQHWSEADWQCVVWGGECAFPLSNRTGSIVRHVVRWACFASGYKGPLLDCGRERGGTLGSRAYMQWILPTAKAFANWFGSKLAEEGGTGRLRESVVACVFMAWFQRNTLLLQTGTRVRSALDGEGLRILDFPPNSADLDLMASLWQTVKSRVETHALPLCDVGDVEDAIRIEWGAVSEDELAALVSTMSSRVRDVVEARGGETRWC